MRFGRASSLIPLSRSWGRNRGTSIARYYIEGFLAEYSGDVRGRVLEVGDDNYSRRFGGSRIDRQDILHLSGHPQATIVGDLSFPGVLPVQVFDCIIFTQTLQFIFDMAAAIDQLRKALRPGGVLLVTVPGITPIGQGEWAPLSCWSLTQTALSRLLSGPFDANLVTLRTYGNLAVATGYLHGAAVEEIGRRRLDYFDPSYPVTVTARAVG